MGGSASVSVLLKHAARKGPLTGVEQRRRRDGIRPESCHKLPSELVAPKDRAVLNAVSPKCSVTEMKEVLAASLSVMTDPILGCQPLDVAPRRSKSATTPSLTRLKQ